MYVLTPQFILYAPIDLMFPDYIIYQFMKT
jgi:hypothetical protein